MNAVVPFNHAPAMTVSDVERVALAIAKGGLFGSKDPNAVLTLCLLAQAEGQHPAVVFRDYHIISGKPAKKAEAMLRDFITAGGKVEWHQLDDNCADATFTHPSGVARISWDHARAQKAGIAGNAMYKKYPRQMLRSRVISEGVRTVYPGATSGLYEESEVASFDQPREAPQEAYNAHVSGSVIEHEPEAATVTTKPAFPEGPASGISKLKQHLRDMKAQGESAPALDVFEEVIANYQPYVDQLQAIDPPHEWWTGMGRDGDTFEGIPAWIERKRQELGGVSELIRSMKEADTLKSLTNWMAANEEAVDALDDEPRRTFELARELHESGLMLEAKVRA
jgi:hypothetical protein